MKIVVAAMVRNEEGRFLRSALSAWKQFADEVLILDDHSEDESVAIAEAAGATIVSSAMTEAAWGAETPLRAQLWNEACARTENGDIIFILDADMVPARNPREFFEAVPNAEGFAFPLYDLWAEYSDKMLMYRSDQFWQGHNNPRVWAVRRQDAPPEGWQWGERGIHCGHLPLNFRVKSLATVPKDYALLHYAYVDEKRRQEKYKQYKTVRPQLSAFEWAHAQSILDPAPFLKTLPFKNEFHLKCGS